MVEKTADEVAKEVYKHELKAGEKMELLITQFGKDGAEEALLNAFNNQADNIDDIGRLEKFVMMAQQFGVQLESQRIVSRVREYAENHEELEVDQ